MYKEEGKISMQLIHLDTPKDFYENDITMEQLIGHYENYMLTLMPYNKELQKSNAVTRDSAGDEVLGALYRSNTDIIMFADDQKHILGFVFIGQHPNAYSKDDIYIQEFYIMEPKQGYGKQAVGMILNEYPGKDVSFFVLRENYPAKLFWKRVMEGNGYKELVFAGEITPPPDDMFEPTLAETIFEYWRK